MGKALFANMSEDIQFMLFSFELHFVFSLYVIMFLLVLHFINRRFKYRLNYLGIYPRKFPGLIGVLCSHFLHGDFNHLFFNLFPLFALMHLILLSGKTAFYLITVFIMVVAGLGTWIVGRRSYHVGASTLIMGYFGYLAAQAYVSPSFVSVVSMGICLFYFGGLVLSLLPTDKSVSTEGHVCGFISGIIAYLLAPGLMLHLNLI